jgi:hypothetical protein
MSVVFTAATAIELERLYEALPEAAKAAHNAMSYAASAATDAAFQNFVEKAARVNAICARIDAIIASIPR